MGRSRRQKSDLGEAFDIARMDEHVRLVSLIEPEQNEEMGKTLDAFESLGPPRVNRDDAFAEGADGFEVDVSRFHEFIRLRPKNKAPLRRAGHKWWTLLDLNQ